MYTRNTEVRSRNHFAVGKQYVLHVLSYVCSLTYPACKAHELYYIMISKLFNED